MTKEELQHRTYIQAAYLSGQLIQLRYRNEFNPKWIDVQNPSFDWECYDYRIKPVAWRALQGKQYYYITSLYLINKIPDHYQNFNNRHYEVGNYFATLEEAEEMRNNLLFQLTSKKV